MRLVATIAIGLAVAFGVGWFLGASGKSAIELQRRQQEERADLSEARALTLDGRVALSRSNFGDAVQRFNAARQIIERVQMRMRETNQPERAGQLEIALAHLKDAGRLSVGVDPNAPAAADEAIKAIESVRK